MGRVSPTKSNFSKAFSKTGKEVKMMLFLKFKGTNREFKNWIKMWRLVIESVEVTSGRRFMVTDHLNTRE